MHHKLRIRLEKKIVRKIIQKALDYGYYIVVDNGEEKTPRKMGRDFLYLCGQVMTVDVEHIDIYRNDDRTLTLLGSIMMVYGNTGYDVVADYNSSFDYFMESIMEYSNKLEERFAS